MTDEMELWERIYEAAARATRDPACVLHDHLLQIVEDLADRGSPRARDWIDEALVRSRMSERFLTAVRAGLHARMGDEARFVELATEVEQHLDDVDADDREVLATHLATGAEALGLTDRVDALIPLGEMTWLLPSIAAERGAIERAEALLATEAFRGHSGGAQQRGLLATARAASRAGDADRARRHLIEAEARARTERNDDLRWTHLTRVAACYAEVGALKDARRLALELDRAMLEPSDPRSASEYAELAVTLHQTGDVAKAREIAEQHGKSSMGNRAPDAVARLWARLGDLERARGILAPLEQAADRGQLSGLTTHASLARTHLALDDVAAALRRAAHAEVDDRIGVLCEIAAHAHQHATATSPALDEALAALDARPGASVPP